MHPSTAPNQSIDRSDDLAESIIASPDARAGGNPAARRQRHSKLIDLSGRTIGRWSVIDRAADVRMPSGRKRVMWNCVCECGYRARIGARSLIRGDSQSCGCLRADLMRCGQDRQAERDAILKTIADRRTNGGIKAVGRMDITGEKFGRWKVLARGEDRVDKSGQTRQLWECECECGTKKQVIGSHLIYGNSRSCGCLRDEVTREARRRARLRRQIQKTIISN